MSENNNEIESKEIETEIQQDSDQLHEKTQSEDSVKDEKLIKYLMDSGFSYKLILSVADEE